MNIDWKLSQDDGVDANNPLGAITISDDDGGVILQEAIYLDSWFEELLAGLRMLVSGEPETLVLVEEPDPLELRLEDDTLVVTQDVYVVRVSLVEAIEEIRAEALEFLRAMQQSAGWEQNEKLVAVQRLLAGARRGLELEN